MSSVAIPGVAISEQEPLIPVYYSADGVPMARAEVPIAQATPIHDDPWHTQSGNYGYNSWHAPESANIVYRRNEEEFFWWYCLCLFFWLLVLIIVIAVTSSVYDDDYI